MTDASWLVWAVTASIMTPIFLLARAVEPNPTWWSVSALGLGAAMSTLSGHRAGRWLEARGAGRPNDGGAFDPRSVVEASGIAAMACCLAWSTALNDVSPAWIGTAFKALTLIVVAAACVVTMWRVMKRRPTGRRGARGAVR